MKNILLVTLFLISTISFSQTISVASFKALPNDMDARIHEPKPDLNGDKCAIIKVVTTQTDFAWDVGTIGITAAVKKVGEYWLYLSWGTKRLTIKHNELGVLRNYIFPEPIEKASVYEMVLTTAKVTTIVEEEKIITKWLMISSQPSGADVYINEKLAGTTPFQRKYEGGKYNYRLELSRYYNYVGVAQLKDSKYEIEAKLTPKFGNISVSSLPEDGMNIFLNGKATGQKTPATIKEVDSGEQTIKLQSQWFQAQAKRVTVVDEQTTDVSFSLEPAFAKITINANPDANILIDGENKGTGTYTGRILEGIYTIKAEKDKYTSQEKQVKITIGKAENLSFTLKGKTGAIDVLSTPMKAKITIDGKEYGTTPNTIEDLLIGEYKLELFKEGFAKHIETIIIKEGEKTEVNKELLSAKEVTINSTPQGAKLYINNDLKGITPVKTFIAFANNEITIDGDSLAFINDDFKIDQNQDVYDFTLVKAEKIKIGSKPQGAKIYIDDIYKGDTPIEIILTKTSSLNIVISDFKTQTRTISFGDNDIFFEMKKTSEGLNWIEVLNSKTKSSYEDYIRNYPTGKHINEAKKKLEELYWQEAYDDNTKYTYNTYIEKYPRGKHIDEAKNKLEELWWQEAYDNNSDYSYNKYIKEYPVGKHNKDAKNKLTELELNLYNKIIKEDAIHNESSIDKYIAEYPNGKYIIEVKNLKYELDYTKTEKQQDIAACITFLYKYKYKGNEDKINNIKNILASKYEEIADKEFENKNFSKAKEYYLLQQEKCVTEECEKKVGKNIKNVTRAIGIRGTRSWEHIIRLNLFSLNTLNKDEFSTGLKSFSGLNGLELESAYLINIKNKFGVSVSLENEYHQAFSDAQIISINPAVLHRVGWVLNSGRIVELGVAIGLPIVVNNGDRNYGIKGNYLLNTELSLRLSKHFGINTAFELKSYSFTGYTLYESKTLKFIKIKLVYYL